MAWRSNAKILISLFIVGAFVADSAFGISCQDDTMGGRAATSCVGCITYILQAGMYYRACSPSVPCTDQNTFNYLANRCAQQYQQCQIQCCTTDMCNSAGGGAIRPPIGPGGGGPGGPGGPIVIVSSATQPVESQLVLGALLASALAFVARFY